MAEAPTPVFKLSIPLAPPAQAVAPAPQFDAAQAFMRENRIHLQHGSYFDPSNPLILVHPRETKPENIDKLRSKIRRVLEQDVPPYFADAHKGVFIEQFVKMIPVSVESKQEAISKNLLDLMQHIQTGKDPETLKQQHDANSPFAAEVAFKLKKNEIGAVEKEMLKNGIGLYLIINQGMQQKFGKGLDEFYTDMMQKRPESPEAMFAHMQAFTGLNPREMVETAQKEGLEGIAKKLGVSDNYVQEVKLLTDVLPDRMFSLNAVEAWEAGRTRPGMQAMGPAEKIQIGMEDLTQRKLMQVTRAFKGHNDLPEVMKPMEGMFAGHLRLLPKELAETLLLLNTEIAYTPDPHLANISDVHAYGFYRRLVKNPGDVNGIYQIFISGHGGPESFAETLVHEAHHLVIPSRLTDAEIKTVDGLAAMETKRLGELKGLLDTWMQGDDLTKAAVTQTINQRYQVNGKTLSQVMGNADMYRVYQMVNETNNQLQIDSNFYYKSGYSEPGIRFAEVFSRYAQMRFVRWREQPELMQFVVPNISQAYETIYMPHIRNQLADLKAAKQNETVAEQPAASVAPATPVTLPGDKEISQSHASGKIPLMMDWTQKVDHIPLTRILAHTAHLDAPLSVQHAQLF